MVDLGKADQIDKDIVALKKAISEPMERGTQKTTELSRRLYDRVFAPIQKELGNAVEIFISPDGKLNLIPFEILQQPDDSCKELEVGETRG